MNFNGYQFDSDAERLLNHIDSSGRLPHAIIIESSSGKKALELAALLSAYAVCERENKPCGECKQCHNAFHKTHADISYIPPDKNHKTPTYSIDQIRAIIENASIRANEGFAKVYVLEDCDRRLSEIAQNAFLKLLEEPPKNVFFILTCKSSKSLLITIISRCAVIKLKGEEALDEEAVKNAEKIVNGIISPKGYELLTALNALGDKDRRDDTLAAVRLILRDALAIVSGGEAIFNRDIARPLAAKLTKGKILEMIELGDDAGDKIKQNVNINLLTTWLCGEYRRISWQR